MIAIKKKFLFFKNRITSFFFSLYNVELNIADMFSDVIFERTMLLVLVHMGFLRRKNNFERITFTLHNIYKLSKQNMRINRQI